MKFGVLRIRDAEGGAREIPLDSPTISVGRAPNNHVVIDDISVASRHARLSIVSGRLMVEDLGSATGTFVGNDRLDPNTPSLAGDQSELRFGEIPAEYFPPGAAIPSENGHANGSAPAPALERQIRATLLSPVEVAQPGGSGVVARLTVSNAGPIVDRLHVTVRDLPAEWIEIDQPDIVLVPGDGVTLAVRVRPPRASSSESGIYDFAVVVTSQETGRDVVVPGTVQVARFDDTQLTLRPHRGKKRFHLTVENKGNGRLDFALRGEDDESSLRYEFEQHLVTMPPGEKREVRVRVRAPRQLFGSQRVDTFRLFAEPDDPEAAAVAEGQLVVRPPLQRMKVPAIYALILIALAGAVLGYLITRPSTKEESPEDLYAGVHLCDKKDDKGGPTPTNTPDTGDPAFTGETDGAPFFAQNNSVWADVEYARAQDPEFGPDWCGDTIAQCGCAMTSVATVMALYALMEMPDGQPLTPESLNAWFNGNATRTDRGWVSQGYVYGDVIWTAANQLSGEMAARNPGAATIRFRTTGTGSEEEIRSELQAGRPIILEVPGHWISAVGLEDDGRIIINDPFYRDRTHLDDYKTEDGKSLVKSSVLFEPSDDLRAVVFSAPSDVRMRITDKEGRVVGTLNMGSAEEAEAAAQVGIPGASYSSRQAWRDPTCIMSAPPPGAGTNQIILPGGAEDYKVEVIDTEGRPTSVAVHTYAANGTPTISEIKGDGDMVADVKVGEDMGAPEIDIIEDAEPTPESEITPAGGNGTPTSGAAGTPTAPEGTPVPTATPTIVPADTIMALPAEAGQTRVEVASNQGFFIGDTIVFSPGTAIEESNTIVGFGSFILATPLKFTHPAGSKIVRFAAARPRPDGSPPEGPPTSSPPPLEAPDTVKVGCSTIYNTVPKRATLICGATIEGEFTSTKWTSNGTVITEATGKESLFLSFTDDEVVVIVLTSCNITICRSTSVTENIRFPAAGTGGTTTGGAGGGPTPTPTPPATGVGVSCNATFDLTTETALIDCLALFPEDQKFTSVSWSAPGANPPNASSALRTFQTRVDDPTKVVPITTTVCNFRVCQTSEPFILAFGETTVEVVTIPSGGSYPQYAPLVLVAYVSGPTPPQGGTVTFKAGAQALGTSPVIPGSDFGFASLTVIPAPDDPVLNAKTSYDITAEFSGSATLFPGTSEIVSITIVQGIADDCDSIDNSVPLNDQIDEDCVYTGNPKDVSAGTLVTGVTTYIVGASLYQSSDVRVTMPLPATSQQLYFYTTVKAATDGLQGQRRQVYLVRAANGTTGTLREFPVGACLDSYLGAGEQFTYTTFGIPQQPGVYYIRVITGFNPGGCLSSAPPGSPQSTATRVIVTGETSSSLAVSPSVYDVGASGDITLTATVDGPTSVVPEGQIEFQKWTGPNANDWGAIGGQQPGGQQSVDANGQAIVTVPKSTLGAGSHQFRAIYHPRVRTELGTGVSFWQTSTSTTQTLTVNNPAVTVTNLSPSSATAGQSSAVSLTVTGTGFLTGTSTVTFTPPGGTATALTTSSMSSTSISASIPSALLANGGTGPITVTNPSPGGGSASRDFTVNYPVPNIAGNGISPSSIPAGSGDTVVTITGTGTTFFSGATTVTFTPAGGTATALTSVTVTSATSITGTIGSALLADGGAGTITVTNPTPGGGSDTATLNVTNAAPGLTSVSPTSKTAGDASFTLTTTGTGFINGKSSIYFGGTTGGFKKTTTCASSTSCSATIPAGDIDTAGTVDVYVITTGPGGGTAGPVTFTVNNPVPAISSLSPNTGTTGGSGFTLTVNGSNFVNGAVVRWGGNTSAENRTTTFVSASQLTAAISSADIATGGTVNVYVFNPAPGGGLSAAATFQVNNPTPTITFLSPNIAGAGTGAFTLTVNGTGFVSGAVVRWGGNTSAENRTTTYVSGTQLTASVLASDIATPGSISVYVFNPAPAGGLSGAATFTVTNPPVISSLSPNSATAGGSGFTLTVNGSNFVSGATVRWGGTTSGENRTTTFVNSGQLTATINASDIATGGTVSVYVFNPGSGGGLSAPATFTVNNPGPTISSLSPTSATAGGAQFTLTVNGTGFVSTSKVRFGGSTGGFDKPTTFVSSTQLTATISAGDIATAGSVNVYVFSPGPGGGTSAAATFTVNNPAPTITTLTPNTIANGSADTALTITGTNFISGVTTVTFDPDGAGATAAVTLTITVDSATQISTTIPSAQLTTAGTAVVTVTNPTPGGGSASANFVIS